MTIQLRSLPRSVQCLCDNLDAPPRLIAHLTIVHHVAGELLEAIRKHFPSLVFDNEAVLFGAATHDLGKAKYTNELTDSGCQHETDGPAILEGIGVQPKLARFARTHGSWSCEELPLEDLLVALADAVWKGQRLEPLEKKVINRIAMMTKLEEWEVFSELDGLLEEIASRGDERLAWQQMNG